MYKPNSLILDSFKVLDFQLILWGLPSLWRL